MIYVETSYYGVSFLYQYTLYPGGVCVQPRVPVHSRGCLCIAEGGRAYPGGACA